MRSAGDSAGTSLSLFAELMKTTITISSNLNVGVFEILDRDAEDVIMIINFYIELGDSEPPKQEIKPGQPARKKVTSATATGGWY